MVLWKGESAVELVSVDELVKKRSEVNNNGDGWVVDQTTEPAHQVSQATATVDARDQGA